MQAAVGRYESQCAYLDIFAMRLYELLDDLLLVCGQLGWQRPLVIPPRPALKRSQVCTWLGPLVYFQWYIRKLL